MKHLFYFFPEINIFLFHYFFFPFQFILVSQPEKHQADVPFLMEIDCHWSYIKGLKGSYNVIFIQANMIL